MTANEMLEIAKKETENLNSNEKFIVRDLFKGYLWNREEISKRLTLGTLFLSFVNENPDMIEKLDKNSSNQQEYKRK